MGGWCVVALEVGAVAWLEVASAWLAWVLVCPGLWRSPSFSSVVPAVSFSVPLLALSLQSWQVLLIGCAASTFADGLRLRTLSIAWVQPNSSSRRSTGWRQRLVEIKRPFAGYHSCSVAYISARIRRTWLQHACHHFCGEVIPSRPGFR